MSWIAALALAQSEVPEVVRSLLDRARVEEAAGDIDEALDTYLEARRLGPDVVDIYLGLGALYHGQGDLEASLGAFVAGLERAPDHQQLLYNAAVAAMGLERPAESRQWVERALAREGDDVQLLVLHAAVLDRLGEGEVALASLRKADAAQPGSAQILFRLGNQLHRLGMLEEAVESFGSAIRQDKNLDRARYNLGAVLIELGRFGEAAESYETALRSVSKELAKGRPVDSSHGRAFVNLGAAYVQTKDWPKALEAYSKALELDPDLVEGQYNRAFVLFEMGDYEAARTAHEKALKLQENLPLSYLQLGDIARRKGDCGLAVQRWEAGLAFYGARDRLQALEDLAGCYADLGRAADAEDAFRTVMEATPEDPELLYELGRLLVDQGRSREARSALEASLRLRPDHLPTVGLLMPLVATDPDASLRRQFFEEALQRFASAPELWPARRSLAELELQAGQWQAAVPLLEDLVDGPADRRADKESPPSTSVPEGVRTWARAALASVRLVTGEAGAFDAETLELLAAGNGAGKVGVAQARALSRARADDAEGALAALEGLADGDDPASKAVQRDRGLLLWSSSRFAEAKSALEGVVGTESDDPTLAIAYGESLIRTNELARGIRWLVRAEEGCAARSASTDAASTDAGTDDSGSAWTVRLPASPKICQRIAPALRVSRLHLGIDLLASGRPDSGANLAAAVLAADPSPAERAMALYLRGTATGSAKAAIADLEAALAGDLPNTLRPSALVDLGIARVRGGDLSGGRAAFEEANTVGGRELAAVLNLGVLFDDYLGMRARALELYEQYSRAKGPRDLEVSSWAARLREVQP